MKKIIRWQGVVAFAAIVALVAVFWVFLIDGIVKRIIERRGTELVGAKVEIADLDVSLVPAGISIVDLRVADPDSPMTNVVEVGRLAVSIDSANLLGRKVVMDEMVMDGVRFGTPRETSGAIAEKSAGKGAGKGAAGSRKGKEGKGFELPTLELPSAGEIVATQELETVLAARRLESDIKAEQERWAARLAALPDEKRFGEYKERLKKIRSGGKGVAGLLGAAGDASALYRDIRADVDLVKRARSELKQTIAEFKARMAALSKLPEKDIRRLKEKYSSPAGAVSNISALLFGNKIQAWIDTFRTWYNRLSPYLAKGKGAAGESAGKAEQKPVRGKGIDVRFREANPVPDFLVRNARASVFLDLGELKGKAQNITLEQNIVGSPTTVEFTGASLKKARSVRLAGVVNYMVPDRPVHTFDLSVAGYSVSDLSLSRSERFPLRLVSAVADLAATGRMDESGLNVSARGRFDGARFSADGAQAGDAFGKAVVAALAGIDSFEVAANIVGPPDNVKIDVSSNIDDVVRQAFASQLKEQLAGFDEKLKAAVMEKAGVEIDEVKESLGGFANIDEDLAKRARLGESLLR